MSYTGPNPPPGAGLGQSTPNVPAGFSFSGIIQAIQQIVRAAYAIQVALSTALVNTNTNNTFTGTQSFQSGLIFKGRVVTASGAVTVATSDFFVFINKTVPAATAVSLPASPESDRVYVVKDAAGNAGANNITITPAAGNIDGSGTYVINTNYGVVRLVYDGSQWLTT